MFGISFFLADVSLRYPVIFFNLRFKKHCLMWPQEKNVTYLEKEHDSLLRTFNLLIQMIPPTSCREEIIITTKSQSLGRVLVKV